MTSKSKYEIKEVSHKYDNIARLGYSLQGKRGGNPQIKDNIGCISAYIDSSTGCDPFTSNNITVNAFEGYGDDYHRRDKCEIVINSKGNEIFRGDFQDLVKICHRRQKKNVSNVLE